MAGGDGRCYSPRAAVFAVSASARFADALSALENSVTAVVRLGVAGGLVLAAVGIAALTVATRHRLVLAVAGGAALGALAALALSDALRLHLGIPPIASAAAGAVAGAAACGWFPSMLPLGVGALLGALLGASFPLGGRAALGQAVAAAGLGFVCLLWAREVAAAFASLAGGLLLGTGIIATFGAHPLAREMAGHPFALLAFAVVAGVAGAALQSARGPVYRPFDGPERPAERG